MGDNDERMTFDSTGIDPGTFVVTSLRGREAMSSLYEIHVTLSMSSDVPLDEEAIGKMLESPAVVGFMSDVVGWLPWSGVLRKIELVFVREGRTCVYRAVLVPPLWYLTQNIRSRVFLDMTVPEIATAVLKTGGLPADRFELHTTKTYEKREYTVQYQESDFDFFCRLLEHEGILFFFDHNDVVEACAKLVIADSNDAFISPPYYQEIEYKPRSGPTGQSPGFHGFSRTYQAVPEHVVLRDFNEQTPSYGLHAGALVSEHGYGLQVLLGEHFPDVDVGKRLAGVRAEERAQRHWLHQALSSMRDLRPGHRIKLVGHPMAEMSDVEYVVTAMRHRAEAHGESSPSVPFSSEVELVPVDVPWRPPRITRRPRVEGLMQAKIDGETPGVPAPIDAQGRYRVLLPFDLAGEVGTPASRWIRKAQAFAGPSYGDHFPLHIGAEVLLGHVEGDPDRPVIVAAMPNPDTTSPVVQDNATQSVIKTMGQIVFELDDSPKSDEPR